MAAHPLHGVVSKHKWAAKYVHEVGRLAMLFTTFQTNYTVLSEPNPTAPGEFLIKIKFGDIPDELVLTVGDALFNLRSSLDLLACALPRLPGKSDNGIYFPVCKSLTEFKASEAQRKIRKLISAAQDFIESCQPYHRGYDRVYVLHRIHIRDKHKSLVPSVANIGVPTSVKHEGVNPAQIIVPNIWNPADQTVTVASVGPDVDTEIKMPVHVAFNEPGVSQGEPIYTVLLECGKTIQRIIEEARRQFYP